MPVTANPEPEEPLVERALAGDRRALDRLLDLVRPELEVFLRLHGADRFRTRESLSDVAQSVCAECVAHLGDFAPRGAGSFRAWLRRLALHKLIDKQRYHLAAARDPARERPVDGRLADGAPGDGTPLEPFADTLCQLPSPSQAAIGREEAELLEAALRQLPEEQRQVVTMARLLGMSHAEIGEVLGKSEPACRMLLKRGLTRLSAIMVDLEERERGAP